MTDMLEKRGIGLSAFNTINLQQKRSPVVTEQFSSLTKDYPTPQSIGAFLHIFLDRWSRQTVASPLLTLIGVQCGTNSPRTPLVKSACCLPQSVIIPPLLT